MLEFMPESEGNILGFRARRHVTLQDFRRQLMPRLEVMVKDRGKARILLFLEDDFEGFDRKAIQGEALGSGWHKDDIEKIAVVGGSWWTKLEIRLGAALLAREVETFDTEDLEDAWEWVKA